MKKLTKRIVFLFVLFMVTKSAAYSQGNNNIVQRMEGEARFGLTLPVGGYHNGDPQVGGVLGLEGRYNFKGTPWDCGLMLELSTACRGYNHLFNNGGDWWQSNRTLAFALTGDYNFKQGTKVNPFVGTAVGIASNDVVGEEVFPSNGTSVFFAPRVGVELFHHFRLATQMNLSRKGHHNLSVMLGLVVGGRPKGRR